MTTDLYTGEIYTMTVAVSDQFDGYVRDGTKVNFSTDLGVLSLQQAETNGGLVSVQYMSQQGGSANLRAIVGSIERSITLDVSEAAQITSSPITSAIVGQQYTYAVLATGVPAPTYSLLARPAVWSSMRKLA